MLLKLRPKAACRRSGWVQPQAQANSAFDAFLSTYEAKYPRAAACRAKDREALLAFYDFPVEHWVHLRTSNVIESTFDTFRVVTNPGTGAFSRTWLLPMQFKLALCAEQSFRR